MNKDSEETKPTTKERKNIARMCPNPDCRAEFRDTHTTICTRCGWVTVATRRFEKNTVVK